MPNFFDNILQYFQNSSSPTIEQGPSGFRSGYVSPTRTAKAAEYAPPTPEPAPLDASPKPGFLDKLSGLFGPTSVTGQGDPNLQDDLSYLVDPQFRGQVPQQDSLEQLIRPFLIQDKAPFPPELMAATIEAAQRIGIDPNILASLIANESGGAGYNVSGAGAAGERGITQIIPGQHFGSRGFSSPDLYGSSLEGDRGLAIDESASILEELLNQFGGDIFSALAAYNAGATGFTEGGYGADYARAALDRIGYSY